MIPFDCVHCGQAVTSDPDDHVCAIDTRALVRALQLRAEKAESHVQLMQASLASAENDLRLVRNERDDIESALDESNGRCVALKRELDVANACLASVRAQRRGWRDECVEARKVVEAAKTVAARFSADALSPVLPIFASDHPLRVAIRAYDAFLAARRTAWVDASDDTSGADVAEAGAGEETKT